MQTILKLVNFILAGRHGGSEESREPMTVKDLIMANIEHQLRKPTNNQPNHAQSLTQVRRIILT